LNKQGKVGFASWILMATVKHYRHNRTGQRA
jgi:hypothetical protein